jgi:hypothetical protein
MPLCSVAQNDISITFHHQINHQKLVLDERIQLPSESESITITTLKYYISSIQLLWQGKTVFSESDSHHLINVEESNSCTIPLHVPKNILFDQMVFCVGIDSISNVSGALGGDLDPTLGMYWTWQSGYINFKLEGIHPKCPARKNEFQFHIGGYQKPYYPLQEIKLSIPNTKQIDIYLQVEKLMVNLDFKTLHHIMMPGKEAMEFSNRFTQMFSTQQ